MDAGNVLAPTDPEADRAEAVEWLLSHRGVSTDTIGSPLASLLTSDLWERGFELGRVGLRADAFSVLRNALLAEGDRPVTLFALAESLRDMSYYSLSIEAASRLVAFSQDPDVSQAPVYVQRLIYPTYYDDLVFSEASRTGMDPLLLFALIRQESMFSAGAKSWAGAIGLTQVMPPTGEWIAQRLNWTGFSVSDLARPLVSVRFGAWYLSQQYDDLGSIVLALAGYNAGEGAARSWGERFGTGDPDLFVESIPYSETYKYVTTVIEQYDAYKRLYRPAQAARP
jgi:soluble lytic murein transglycosylase